MSVEVSTPEAVAKAKMYCSDIEFASQLCGEIAVAEKSNTALSVSLLEAQKMLGRIVIHNSTLRDVLPDHQPTFPLHRALIRFDLPLQRLTRHFLVAKKWKQRFHILRGNLLYYSNKKDGKSDTLEAALSFVQSNPRADMHYCMDLSGLQRFV